MQREGKIKIIPELRWELDVNSLEGKSVGDLMMSPEFSFSQNSTDEGDFKTCWTLVFYPKGNTKCNQNFVSLFLLNLSSFGVTANVQLSHSYQGSTSKCVHIKNRYFPPKPAGEAGESIGYSRYFDKTLFLESLKKNEFFIKCKVEIIKIYKKDAHLALAETNSQARNFEAEPCDYIEKLLTNRVFSDVTIKAQGKDFYLHKCILSTRSPVFEVMFKQDIVDNKQRIVEINNFHYKVLQELFRYIYVGKFCESVSEDIVCDLLACAEVYGIDGLKKLCEDKMCSKLNHSNVINYYNIALQAKAKDLETQVIEYIGRHLENFINTDQYSRLSLEHPQVSIEITKIYVNSKNQ